MKDARAGLDQDAVEYLRRRGEQLDFSDGEAIVRRGDPGSAFYVVLSGRVEVRLSADTDSRLPLVSLEEGAFFGELSVITGEVISADVVAIGPVKVLRFPGEHFGTALSECASLRNRIMVGLAKNLQRTTRDAWNFFQRAEALHVLMDTGRHEGSLIAESQAMRKVLEGIEALPAGNAPVLVTGEDGTGKTFVAAKIHERSREGRPFIVVDCRSLPEEEAVPFLFGTSWFRRGDAAPEERFGSLQNYGAVHLANRGTLVLKHVDTLPPSCQKVLADYLDGVVRERVDYPLTRVIATTGKPPRERAGGGGLEAKLAPVLNSRVIPLPALRERRIDILPLAGEFLARHRRRPGQAFSISAEHTLISRRYTHRNVAELEEAIELAALFAEGDQIEAEHIFTGPKDQGSDLELDLQKIPLVRHLTSRPVLRAARVTVFAFFAAIIGLSLFFGHTFAGRAANTVTWAVWEPALFLVFFFVGRVWCTACPLSTAGRIANRLKCFGRQPDGWMKTYTGWLVAAGFLAIVWAEHRFGMFDTPRSAGFLLLTLMAAAVFFSVVYRRETWCRYLCPLGNLGAVYSLPAMLNVRANPNVCATFCKTHECYKGTKELPGCPVFHHPLYARDAHHCKQCCTCLWTCPHSSARLYLRLPLQSVWRQSDLGGGLVPFAGFLFFFSPFMLASQGASWASTTGGFTFTALLALLFTVAFQAVLPRLLSPSDQGGYALAPRTVFALLVLSWGPAMAYQINHIGGLESLRIHAEPGTVMARLLGGGEISVQVVLQLAVIALAALLAALCVWGVRMRAHKEGIETSPRGWALLFAICAVYTLSAVILVLPRGVFF